MNILVTGGCGFIGSNFIHYMMKKYPEYKIANVDCLTYAANKSSLEEFENNENYTFIGENILNAEKIFDTYGGGVDVIISLAAESHVDNSINGSGVFIDTNIVGTHRLLEAARKRNIKFVSVSTDEVYGSLGEEDAPFTERSYLRPSSPYSASKTSADHLVMAYYKTYGLPAMITRCSNNYGPYQYIEKFIPLFITNCLQGKDLPLYGTGRNIRDWIYVEDHCRAIDLVLHNGVPGEIYNVGGGCERRNIDIANAICDITGTPRSKIKLVEDRKGHDWRYAITYSKIRRELGWNPSGQIEEHLEEIVSWYDQNRSWWNGKY